MVWLAVTLSKSSNSKARAATVSSPRLASSSISSQGLYAVLPGKLKVGDGSHRIGPQLHRIDHQLFAVGVAQDALLREGHDLDVH